MAIGEATRQRPAVRVITPRLGKVMWADAPRRSSKRVARSVSSVLWPVVVQSPDQPDRQILPPTVAPGEAVEQRQYEQGIRAARQLLAKLPQVARDAMREAGDLKILAEAIGRAFPAFRITCPKCGKRWYVTTHRRCGNHVKQWMRCGCPKPQTRIVPTAMVQRRKPKQSPRNDAA